MSFSLLGVRVIVIVIVIVIVLSLARLPRMPSNTVLVSGPAVGAAQTLILSYCCVFLPPVSTAVRTSVSSFMRVLIVL